MNDNLHTRLTSETLVKADIKARAEACFDVLAGIESASVPDAETLRDIYTARQTLMRLMRRYTADKESV